MSIVLGTVVALYAIVVDHVFKQGMGSTEAARLSGDVSVQCSCSADVNTSDTRPGSEHGLHSVESELEASLASCVAEAASAEPAGPPPPLVADPDEPASSAGAAVTSV